MTSISAGRSTHNPRRVHLAVGTAAAIVAAATVGVGPQLIPVAAPVSDTTPFCSAPYECVQPGTDQPLPLAFKPLVASGPATWISGMPS
jgi:hypothetical protein